MSRHLEIMTTGRRAEAAGGVRADAFPPVRRERFAVQVYDHLFHRIVSGELAEGAALPSETALCRLFEVSRPVVREALERLKADGLIVARRGAGTYVKPRRSDVPSAAAPAEKIGELLENLEFRSVVEPEAAFLAAERRNEADLAAMRAAVEAFARVAIAERGIAPHLDYAFHHAVAVASANRRLVAAVRDVEHDIGHGVNLMRHLARLDPLERGQKVHAEHSAILAAIARRDGPAARALMRHHLDQARLRMLSNRADG